jgi:multidrug resistance efflux pump
MARRRRWKIRASRNFRPRQRSHPARRRSTAPTLVEARAARLGPDQQSQRSRHRIRERIRTGAGNVGEAKAALNQAQAALEVSKQSLATIIVNRSLLEANVASAEATVHLAEIDLQNTSIVAPRDGHLGEVGVRLGQYVTAGTQLMAVVPEDVWVVANFKETQLEGMQVGQPVSIIVDALGKQRLTGRIERFSPAAGSEFAVIKA